MFDSRRILGPICIALGILLILASFGGSWGPAYGQTVVTPTPHIEVADPQISKTAQPSCCSPGDTVVFTIVVTNIGTAPATNVVISDTVPAELSLTSVTTTKGTVTINGNQFVVAIGTVSPGEIVTITVTTTVLITTPVDVVISNIAYLTSDQGSRQASANVTIKEIGACATPTGWPRTGGPVEAEEGTSPWLLVAGLLLLLLGIALTVRTRRGSPQSQP